MHIWQNMFNAFIIIIIIIIIIIYYATKAEQ